MATYGSLVAQIISEMGRSETSLTANVETEVLAAIDFYETQRFWFNEGATTLTTSSSLAYYSWPTDLLEVDAVTAYDNGVRYELEPWAYKDLNQVDTGQDFSLPVAYAMFNSSFRLYPCPNKTYTVVVDYQKRLATLSASTDSNAWTNQASQLIKAHTKAALAANRWKDFEAAQAWAVVEERELERLRLQTEKLLATGKISPG